MFHHFWKHRFWNLRITDKNNIRNFIFHIVKMNVHFLRSQNKRFRLTRYVQCHQALRIMNTSRSRTIRKRTWLFRNNLWHTFLQGWFLHCELEGLLSGPRLIGCLMISPLCRGEHTIIFQYSLLNLTSWLMKTTLHIKLSDFNYMKTNDGFFHHV